MLIVSAPWSRRRWTAIWLIAVCVLAAARPKGASSGIDLQLVASNLPALVDIQHANDGSGRLFLVEQSGRILVYSSGQVQATPWLDLTSQVLYSGEQGLLGLAFHPQFATNGVFFVHYTSPDHTDPAAVSRSVIARYRVSASNPNVADPAGQILLTYDQPFSNHNGGQLRFGPDGYLYIALGDGGSGGDPLGNGQRLDTMLGKLLRIDVNDIASPSYAIPPDNPFPTGERPEIWAYGLRNPWRFSFDRQTGDLWIGDVGQNAYEEVNLQPAGAAGGRNYGWNQMEGFHCYASSGPCTFGTLPVLEYSHSLGCSITGGFRYRGTAVPDLAGTYLFADYCAGTIWGATSAASGAWTATQLLDTTLLISAFGEDPSGELYVADYSAGRLYRLVAAASPSATLSVSKRGHGTGRVTTSPTALDCGYVCAAQFPIGTSVTLTPAADAGSTFVEWSGDADCADGGVALSSDRACAALFGAAFTDDVLTAGVTAIKAVHVTELRTRVDALRVSLGLTAFAWTDIALGAGVSVPRAVHVTELRAALSEAYASAALAAPTFTNPGLTSGDPIRATYINELRHAVQVLEAQR